MVARRDHVGAQVEQFLRDRRRQPEPARRVFPIDNQQIDRIGLHHMGKMLANDAPACVPKHVSNKENIHF